MALFWFLVVIGMFSMLTIVEIGARRYYTARVLKYERFRRNCCLKTEAIYNAFFLNWLKTEAINPKTESRPTGSWRTMPWLIAMWCINAIAGITLSAMLIHFRHRFSLKRWLRGGNNEKASVSPSVSVVIAARNEEHSVERTLREFASPPGCS